MAPAVEFVTTVFQPGSDFSDPDAGAGKALYDTLKTLHGRKGLQSIHWGRQVENPVAIDMVIAWEDLQAHQDFMADPSYALFVDNLMNFLSAPPKPFHIEEPGDLISAVSAPVTEVFFCYASFGVSKPSFEEPFSRFVNDSLKKASGCVGVASAWSIEDAEHAAFAEEGGKGRRYASLIGWKSIDEHLKCKQTQDFKSTIPLVRANVKGMEMHHTQFQPYLA